VAGLSVPPNFLYYLLMHEKCSDQLLCKAKRLSAEDVELSAHPQAVQIRKMVSSVLMELHKMMGFVRLKPLGPFVLYGYLKPKHKIGSHICSHFARRSPNTIVLLGNGLESWISLCAEKDIFQARGCGLDQSLQELKGAMDGAGRDCDVEEAWRAYYSSQYSPERRNIQAFGRRMPRVSLDSAGLELEKNKNGLTLKDFFGDD
jgi:probable DNA metabolism protein